MFDVTAVTAKTFSQRASELFVLTIFTVFNAHAFADIVLGRLGSVISPIAKPSTVAVGEGIDTYLKKINAAGGLNGQKISVVFRDDEFKPDKSIAAAQALIEQQVKN
jgi:branched-chain amino acid transport system substrate-binding protein